MYCTHICPSITIFLLLLGKKLERFKGLPRESRNPLLLLSCCGFFKCVDLADDDHGRVIFYLRLCIAAAASVNATAELECKV